MQKHSWPVVCLAIACLVPVVGQTRKTIETQAEYQLYDAVVKDFAANDFAKAIADLDAWKQKYPATVVSDERQYLYVQAYNGVRLPAKVLETAGPLLDRDSLENPADIARLLYSTSVAIQQITEPSPAQLTIGEKAAHKLASFDRIPSGASPEEWEKTKTDLRAVAAGALRHVVLVPAAQALRKNDCASADSAARKALAAYPESAQAAWYLGSAALCQYRTQPEKASLMLYEFARAASLDPIKSFVDPAWQKSTAQTNLEKLYKQYHGDDPDGLRELKRVAVASPLPPDGFTMKSSVEIVQEKQAAFELEHPELALWSRVKSALTAPNGAQYFEDELKETAVPQLRGVVVKATPECRPTELQIAISDPKGETREVEIAVKLDKPIAGKLTGNPEIVWEGVPVSFQPAPFLLIMEAEAAKVSGIETAPCTPAAKPAPRRAAPSKTAPKQTKSK